MRGGWGFVRDDKVSLQYNRSHSEIVIGSGRYSQIHTRNRIALNCMLRQCLLRIISAHILQPITFVTLCDFASRLRQCLFRENNERLLHARRVFLKFLTPISLLLLYLHHQNNTRSKTQYTKFIKI